MQGKSRRSMGRLVFLMFTTLRVEVLMHNWQGYHVDKEQPVLCEAGGCRTIDRSGISAEAKLETSLIGVAWRL